MLHMACSSLLSQELFLVSGVYLTSDATLVLLHMHHSLGLPCSHICMRLVQQLIVGLMMGQVGCAQEQFVGGGRSVYLSELPSSAQLRLPSYGDDGKDGYNLCSYKDWTPTHNYTN